MSVGDVVMLLGKLLVMCGYGLDSKEVKKFDELVKLLKVDEVKWNWKEVKEVSGRERRFGKEDVLEIYRLREKGFSWGKIGEMKGCSGMMIGNVLGGKIYKDVIEELKKEGKLK